MPGTGQQRGHEGDQQLFDRLLAFLNSDRSEEEMTPEEAREQRGARYEEIRHKQIRLFAWRGCPTPDLLADKTFDRVMEKLDELEQGYTGNPAHYISRVGRFVFLESLREPLNPEIPPEVEKSEEDERALTCLERCLKSVLEPEERELVLDYYRGEKRAKIDHRREIAKRHQLSVNALRIECCRLRRRLRKCLLDCVRLK